MNNFYTKAHETAPKIPFKFKTEEELDEYISICTEWCGGIPLEVNWAMNTNTYKEILKHKKIHTYNRTNYKQ